MASKTILLIEDNEDIRLLVKAGLRREDIKVHEARDAEEGLFLLREKIRPDVILLDIMLPAKSGIEALPEIRKQCDAPVIIISAKNTLKDKVTGLDVGADDYLTKPFEMPELVARVNANIRRENKNGGIASGKKIRFGHWVMHPTQYQVFKISGESAELTPNEYRLLEVLISAPQTVFTREQLLEKTRVDALDMTDRAIDTQISRIRRKLGEGEDGQSFIQPVRGVGYCFSHVTRSDDE